MSGAIKLTKLNPKNRELKVCTYETDTVDFNPDLGIETFGGMKSSGDQVDYFGEQTYRICL